MNRVRTLQTSVAHQGDITDRAAQHEPACALQALVRRIGDDATCSFAAGVEGYSWISDLGRSIADLAVASRDADADPHRLLSHRIESLAKLVSYLADDFSNTADIARETLEKEDLPQLLAAIGGSK